MPRIPYYDVENATGKHAEFLGKLQPMLNIFDSGEVDGVLFYVPLEDDVVGWDYPRHLDFLRKRNLPSVLVRSVAAAAAPVSSFIAGLRSK